MITPQGRVIRPHDREPLAFGSLAPWRLPAGEYPPRAGLRRFHQPTTPPSGPRRTTNNACGGHSGFMWGHRIRGSVQSRGDKLGADGTNHRKPRNHVWLKVSPTLASFPRLAFNRYFRPARKVRISRSTVTSFDKKT